MVGNKNRVYMAFYARPDGKYHLAVLVVPKVVTGDEQTSWRLHAINRPDVTQPSQQRWDYDGCAVSARTSRLLALALLGKTEMSGKAISDLVDTNVKRKQGDPAWNCKSWAFSAIDFLRSKGIVSPGIATSQLYDIGARIAFEQTKLRVDDRLAKPVPTYDVNGKAIASEVN